MGDKMVENNCTIAQFLLSSSLRDVLAQLILIMVSILGSILVGNKTNTYNHSYHACSCSCS